MPRLYPDAEIINILAESIASKSNRIPTTPIPRIASRSSQIDRSAFCVVLSGDWRISQRESQENGLTALGSLFMLCTTK